MSMTNGRRCCRYLLGTVALFAAFAEPTSALQNVSSSSAVQNESDPTIETYMYELPSRIHQRPRDDQNSGAELVDIDPIEREGMTAAIAEHFAKKLIHEIDVDEAAMHTSSSGSGIRNGLLGCWGAAVATLHVMMTCLFVLDQMPRLSISYATKRKRRPARCSAVPVVGLLFVSICVTRSALPADALHVSVSCSTEVDSSRRSAMSQILAAASLGIVHASSVNEALAAPAGGSDELYLAQPLGPPGADGKSTRPSAPLECLVPAARVGIYIYETLGAAEDVAKLQRTEDAYTSKLPAATTKLDTLFLKPPAFIKPTDPKVSRGDSYNAPPILGEVGMAAKKRKERREQSIDADFVSELFEPGQLIGERMTSKRLQRVEMQREAASEIRRALNVYTTNLNFSRDRYEFKGSPEEKRNMIRNDRLPSASAVITSDLDSRDLFRNQVQTALEDAKAEFEYLKRENSGDISKADLSELIALLKDSQSSIDKWFGFISDADVKAALDVVRREQQEKRQR